MGFPAFTLADYEITPDGEVFNKRWNRKVKPQPNRKGYLRFSLGGKFVFVHRLVAQLYVPNPENKPQVNHKDGNKLNNRASNLEWVTNKENRDHAIAHGLHICGGKCPWSKLTRSDVDYIRSHMEVSSGILANQFGVTRNYINAIKRHDKWK